MSLCWELGKLEFQKFLFIWISVTNMIIFEVQHAYAVMKIKEVMSIQTFFSSLEVPNVISCNSFLDTFLASRFSQEVLWLNIKNG